MTSQHLKNLYSQKIAEKIKENIGNIKLNPKNIDIFFNYINERHLIYKRRFINKKPAPWTKDKILQQYKFTNVFRDLDPGTKFVINDIAPKCNSLKEIMFNLIIYRLYNKISTFKTIGIQNPDNFDCNSFESKLRALKESGNTVFTNAFMVSSYHWIDPWADKISNTTSLINKINDDLNKITKKILDQKNSSNTFYTLLNIKGIGKFLAYQISVDLGYWNKNIFNEDVFVIAGPGCRRGIDYVFDSKGNLNYEESIHYICRIQDKYFNKLGIDRFKLFSDRKEKKLNIMSLENCFCEISKYLKVFYGIGRPRNKFNPS